MDKLPQELVSPPRPLVFLTGEVETQPNLHDELIAQLYLHAKNDPKHEVNMKYESISNTYRFKEKSPAKDSPSSDGVLKLDWMYKHCTLLPSLVILTTAFGTDWPAGEWIRRETTIIERITKLKQSMHQRDVKVILVLMKFGRNSIDKDVVDERLSALKRHCQLDSKSFVTLLPKDLLTGTKDSVKRLTKTVRDYSAGYYASQGKRLRGMERLIRPSDHLLLARMNFKVAFMYEFQLQVSRALRNYKQCYAALFDLLKLSKSLNKPELISQIKAVAEMVNFKLCNIHLKSGGVKEASQQFRNHMKNFSAATTQMLWHDHTWASNQYLIYVSLLAHFAINTNHTDADRSYYYHRAAICTQKRQEEFHAVRTSTSVEEIENVKELSRRYAHVVTENPSFFGSAPQYTASTSTAKLSKLTASSDTSSSSSPPSSADLWALSRHTQLLAEESVNHTDEILALLQKSLKNMNPLHKRRRAHIRVLIAKQLMSIGDYDMASAHLSAQIEFLHREQWSFCAIPVLRKKILCSIYLGRPREYIPAALKLYKIAVLDEFFETEDRMDLHRDLMSVICNAEKPSVRHLQENRGTPGADAGASVSLSLPLRPEYGAAAIDTHPAEYYLPDSYVVELGDAPSCLFQITVTFDSKSVEVGHHVRTHIAVTSLFQDVLTFTEMTAYFSDDSITQKFIHVDEEREKNGSNTDTDASVVSKSSLSTSDMPPSISSSIANVSHVCLEFHPNVRRLFSFDLFISENSLHKSDVNHVCLERLLMTMSVPLPTQMASEYDVSPVEEVNTDKGDSVNTLGECKLEEYTARVTSEKQDHNQGSDALQLLHDGDEFPTDETLTFQGAESEVITTEDVTADMEEESLDVTVGENGASGREEVESTEVVEEEREEFMRGGDKSEDDDEDDDIGGDDNEDEDEDDDEDDNEDDDDDEEEEQEHDDLTPLTSPSRPPRPCQGQDDNFSRTRESTPSTLHAADSMEEEEDDDEYDDGEDNRMSTSRLGMVVPDVNKLDPVMPVVVDKEMQTNRSRSSSLTPSYAAELMSSVALPPPPPEIAPLSLPSASPSCEPESVLDHDGLNPPIPSLSPALSSPLSSSILDEPAHLRTQSLPPKLSHKHQNCNDAMRIRGYREIFFNASALSKSFREARLSNFGTPKRLKEVADFLDVQNAPKLLAVTPPVSYLELLSPFPNQNEPICILQGTIQRLNFVFSSGQHKILLGNVFLESDYHQLRTSTSGSSNSIHPNDCNFFWYPDISSFSPSGGSGTGASQSQSELDLIHFHPLLNSAEHNQPLCPMRIPDQEKESLFVCPVFIKSDVQGDLALTVRVEYIPSNFLKSTKISKEFVVKIRVLKPFGMSFNITSLRDPHCGAEKKQGTSTVLRGDVVNMAASLDCVNSLSSDVEVLVMSVTTKSAAVVLDESSSDRSIEAPVFKLVESNMTASTVNGDSVCNLLQCGISHLPSVDHGADSCAHPSHHVVKSYITRRDGENQTVILQKGEAYVGSADLQCLKLDSVLGDKNHRMFSEGHTSVSASMGDIIVNWRINDPKFFSSVDLSPFQGQGSVASTADGNIADDDAIDETAADNNPLTWLLPLRSDYSGDSGVAVNSLITHTRVCNMLFSVPKVQIVDAPFAVEINSPSVANCGEAFRVHFNIFNKSRSLERLLVVVELTNEFLMTGGTNQALEIAPCSDIDVELTLLPLVCGQVPLPHVCVTCERTKSTVLEFGTYSIPRHVFVRPMPVEL